MNADIPTLRCWVRTYCISRVAGMEEAYAFGLSSIPGRALAFHVMLKSGAHFRHVPIHALALNPDAAGRSLGDCQLWDCFSFRPEVHVFSYLRDHECVARLRSGSVNGTYLFTVDWLPDSWERPGFTMQPEQNKCAHVLALEDGNLAALPTNRIAWKDSYFCGSSPRPWSMGYCVQEEVHQAEDSSFDVSHSDGLYYEPSVGASFTGSLAPTEKSNQRQPKDSRPMPERPVRTSR